jgi:glyoxylase-like metal-dependent hydrolase (beta-lactamase superfamily II)
MATPDPNAAPPKQAAPIQHRRDMDFDYGRVDQLSPLVRRVICKNPGPFTYKGTGTYLIGTGRVAVLDPGPMLEVHLESILSALGPDEEVSHILVSHTHSDHSPGAKWLKERTGAKTHGFGPHGAVGPDDPDDKVDFSGYITPEEKARYDKEYEDLDPALKREGPDLEFRPDERLEDGDELADPAGGWTLTALHTPGHCSNHLCFALAEETSLFSGDHVMGWATSVVGPPDGSMGDYMRSLRKLLPRIESTFWPTHGPDVADPIPYVRSFIAHREDREAQILGFLRERPQHIADMVPTLYAAYDKRLWYPAAASVYAHVLGMVQDGRVAVDGGGEPKLTSIYRLV